MTTTKTLDKQLKALKNVARGGWVKFQSSYYTNAFEVIETSRNDFKITFETRSDYHIGVTKDDDRWFVFAEDHDTDELFNWDHPVDGFKTLKEAKLFAEEFGETFENAWLENYG